jgi:hypothetical protein
MTVTLEDPRIVWTLEKLPGWKVNRAAEFPQFGTCSAPPSRRIQLGVLPGMIIITYIYSVRDFDDVLKMEETSSSKAGWLASSSFKILQNTR